VCIGSFEIRCKIKIVMEKSPTAPPRVILSDDEKAAITLPALLEK